MGAKMWEVKFYRPTCWDKWVTVTVLAPNAKYAVDEARRKKKGDQYFRVQDVTEVQLVGEED